MGRQKTVPIPRFEAFDESGQPYSIIGSQKMTEAPDEWRAGASEVKWVPGAVSLRTVEGLRVTHLGQGTYEIQAATPIRVTSTDPRAP